MAQAHPAHPPLLERLAQPFRQLGKAVKRLFSDDGYRPEKHYMRGPRKAPQVKDGRDTPSGEE